MFGDLNDPESKVSRMAGSGRSTRLLEELGTKPESLLPPKGNLTWQPHPQEIFTPKYAMICGDRWRE